MHHGAFGWLRLTAQVESRYCILHPPSPIHNRVSDASQWLSGLDPTHRTYLPISCVIRPKAAGLAFFTRRLGERLACMYRILFFCQYPGRQIIYGTHDTGLGTVCTTLGLGYCEDYGGPRDRLGIEPVFSKLPSYITYRTMPEHTRSQYHTISYNTTYADAHLPKTQSLPFPLYALGIFTRFPLAHLPAPPIFPTFF